ncbi:MAG TPA: hypothetical protein VN868_00225, partial [Terriglobales bacterium]|nr:hypothetical protein [Terriglobales bacterium]
TNPCVRGCPAGRKAGPRNSACTRSRSESRHSEGAKSSASSADQAGSTDSKPEANVYGSCSADGSSSHATLSPGASGHAKIAGRTACIAPSACATPNYGCPAERTDGVSPSFTADDRSSNRATARV